MKHIIVTRFAVPRPRPGTAGLYRDRQWLGERMRLFRRFFVPSVDRLGISTILLCASEAAAWVAAQVGDLDWARVEVQDDWAAGWQGAPDETLTRLDSDDAVHPDWFAAIERTPETARICICKQFLRWDLAHRRLHRYRRSEPSPLVAFRGGTNPYAVDHKHLEQLDGVHRLDGDFLLQVVHGSNVKNRPTKPWRFDRRVSMTHLADFGVEPLKTGPPQHTGQSGSTDPGGSS